MYNHKILNLILKNSNNMRKVGGCGQLSDITVVLLLKYFISTLIRFIYIVHTAV